MRCVSIIDIVQRYLPGIWSGVQGIATLLSGIFFAVTVKPVRAQMIHEDSEEN